MTTPPDESVLAEWLRIQRAGWSDAAPIWDRWFESFEAYAAPLSTDLIELARVEPGARVLDVGCGNGEPSLTIARRVQPNGSVLGIDLAEPMVELARRRAVEAGAQNVEFRVRSADNLADLGTFDAGVSRFVLMLVPDPVAAARAIRSALRPGARFAACVWGEGHEVPFFSVATGLLHSLWGVALPTPDVPGPLRLGRPGSLMDVLREAGFDDVSDVVRSVEPRFESVAAASQYMCAVLSNVRRALEGRSASEQVEFEAALESALLEHRRDDGSVVLRSTVRVAAGRAP